MNSSREAPLQPCRNSRKFRLISQNLVPHDAVSRHIFEVGTLLEFLGHEVIYHALGIAPEYKPRVKPISLLSEIASDEIVFYQYSIWDENLETVAALKNQKIAYYHGITSPSLLEKSMPQTAIDCQRGLDAIPTLKNFDWILSNSIYDLNEIKECFAPKNALVLPPYVSNQELKPIKDDVNRDPFHLICVGRFFPHKNLEKVIQVYRDLKSINSKYRLTLAGSGVLPSYLGHLREISSDDNSIEFKLNLSVTDLRELYQSSSALLQFSKHEGFGLPFIEAFQLQLPVVTHSFAAIPETLCGAGILIEDGYTMKDIQALNYSIINNRNEIIDKQNQVFTTHYSDEVVRDKYINFIQKVTSS